MENTQQDNQQQEDLELELAIALSLAEWTSPPAQAQEVNVLQVDHLDT